MIENKVSITNPFLYINENETQIGRHSFLNFPQTAFTSKKDYGRGEREAQWATAQRTLHGLQQPNTSELFNDKNNYRELSEIAEQARKRAEVAR